MRPIVLFGLLSCSTAIGQTTVAGFTPGSFRVTESGAAEYRIPIRVPPGIAGVEPKLALVYNSQAGNGLLGVGWNLEGLSAITRCPRTMAQDGVRGGVNYDWNDRYCLDGQRLIALSGTEYRTERESFSKIVSYGTAGNGPAWFKVWTKSGLVLEYGKTDDSRIEAQGKPTVRVWALNNVADTRGNAFAVTYSEDNPNGDYRPDRIDYAGHSLRFSYGSRTDVAVAYVSGSAIKTTRRLTNLVAYAGANPARDYRLTYDNAGVMQRSRLVALTECSPADTCLPSTVFSWTPGGSQVTFSVFSQGYPAGWDYSEWPHLVVGDFDGDGRADYLRAHGGVSDAWLNNGNGTFRVERQSYPGGWDYSGWPRFVVGDFNGDGRTDYLRAHGGVSDAWLSNGDGTFRVERQSYPNGWDYSGWPHLVVGDFNGDGKSDYLRAHGGVADAWLSNGDGTFRVERQSYPSGWDYSGWPHLVVGDFNGDGNSDYLRAHGGVADAWLSNGDGTFRVERQSYPSGWDYSGWPHLVVGDFNGDGKSDYLRAHGGVGDAWLSNGDGTFRVERQSYPGGWDYSAWPHFVVGDFSGDGRTDYLRAHAGLIHTWSSASGEPFPDLVTTISDGLGATTSLDHRPLTDATVYTKDTTSTYPQVDIRAPIYVVASVQSGDGKGGTRTLVHSYGGLKADAGTGRGMLGFRWYESTQQATGWKMRTERRQDWPYLGLPSLVRKTQGSGALLSQTLNTYGSTQPATGVYFPFVSQSIESGNDLNGAALPTVTTDTSYDVYGNPTSIVVSTPDGHGRTTTNTYLNDALSWLLGRLTRSTVHRTSP